MIWPICTLLDIVQPSISQELQKYVEQGHWFLSLYNDNGDAQEVVFASSISQEMTEGCPNGCTGNGECEAGHCQCNAGFGGDDCSQSKSLSSHSLTRPHSPMYTIQEQSNSGKVALWGRPTFLTFIYFPLSRSLIKNSIPSWLSVSFHTIFFLYQTNYN